MVGGTTAAARIHVKKSIQLKIGKLDLILSSPFFREALSNSLRFIGEFYPQPNLVKQYLSSLSLPEMF